MRIPTLFLLAAWLGMGCAGLPGFGPPAVGEEESRAYDEALAQRASDPEATRQALEQFIATRPRSALADDAQFELAELAVVQGDSAKALDRFYALIRQYPRGDRADPARVRIAALEFEAGNPEEVQKVLGRARLTRLEPEQRRVAYRLLADAAPDPVTRLRWLAQLRTEEPDAFAVDRIDLAFDQILGGLTLDELTRASGQIGEGAAAARVELARAERALEGGDTKAARRALDRAARLPLAPRYTALLGGVTERLQLAEQGPTDISQLPTFADALTRGVPATSTATGTLGVVLPLSGPFARFGEESLQGVLLAAGVFGRVGGFEDGPKVNVLVRDSGGNPERAAAAVHELAQDPSVSAIVGPLLTAECESAADAAEAEGVPLLTLTARDEIARRGNQVFRLRTRPEEETQLLVDRAMADFDAQRFAVLYRDDAYGRGLRSLFWDAVEERGGKIVGVASYNPEATDFAEPIRRLLGYELLSDDEKGLLRKREQILRRAGRVSAEKGLALRQQAREMTTTEGGLLPPIVDFDALFIPESHENMVLIAPQLAFHDALDTRLLGPDGWYHPELVRLAGEHVEGALFTAHFYADSPLEFVRDFSERYERTFGRVPDVFAAEAFDAANLVLVQLARGSRDRETVRQGMLTTHAYPGVAGVLTMRADGNAYKRPYLLGIERGKVVQYDQ